MSYQNDGNQFLNLQSVTGSWFGNSWSCGTWSGSEPSFTLKPIAKVLQVGAVGLGLAHTAQAATITVNSSADDGSGGCTLREAINSVNNGLAVGGCSESGLFGINDTIYFGGAMATGGTIALSGGETPSHLTIASTKSVTIDASSTSGVTINAAPDSRIFYVNDSATLQMHNLTISGGSVPNYSNGGGIHLGQASNLVAYNSTITNNYSAQFGGGIFGSSDSNISLTGSTVTGNTAGQDGGGIYSTYGNGTIYLSGTQLTNNMTLYDEGGGLWSTGGKTISLVNSTVSGNSSADQGGGLYIAGNASLTLYNSSVTANNSGEHGGGIYMAGGESNIANIVVYGSDISNNTAGGPSVTAQGGGLFFDGDVGGEGGENSLQNSTITGNSATGDGGGVYFKGSYGPSYFQVLYTQDTVIKGNSAGGNGGGIAVVDTAFTVDNTRIRQNLSSGNGGGVHVDSKAFIYSFGGGESTASAIISGNSATLKGGGLYISPDSGGVNGLGVYNQLRATTIHNNKSGFRGGGIYQAGGSISPPDGSVIEIQNSTISENTSGLTSGGSGSSEGGGIAIADYGEINITNSTISGNSGGGWGGGGIYNRGVLTLSDSTMSDSSGDESLYNLGSNAAASISRSIIANTAGGTPDCANNSGSLIIDAFSIIEDGTCGATRSGDPGLRPLGSNGGPTETHMLRETSIARDTGGTSCPSVDQRFEVRLGTLEDACDVGAVEINENDITTFFVIPLPNGKSVVIAL